MRQYMKPTDLMRQMKSLLPTDSRSCTTFMAMLLLRFPSEMRDLLFAKDFQDCILMVELADLVHSSRATCSVAAVDSDYDYDQRRVGRSPPGFFHPETSAAAPLGARGTAAGRPLAAAPLADRGQNTGRPLTPLT
jgi:hypothetical protein